MKKILSILSCIILLIAVMNLAESVFLVNLAIVIFSASTILFFYDGCYDINGLFIAISVCIAGTIFFTGESLAYVAINCLGVIIFFRIAGYASFNSCDLFFTFLRRRKLTSQIFELYFCNDCHFHDLRIENGDCELFGLFPTGIKWSQKTCYNCHNFQQGELNFFGFKLNYSKHLGFYKKTRR